MLPKCKVLEAQTFKANLIGHVYFFTNYQRCITEVGLTKQNSVR